MTHSIQGYLLLEIQQLLTDIQGYVIMYWEKVHLHLQAQFRNGGKAWLAPQHPNTGTQIQIQIQIQFF